MLDWWSPIDIDAPRSRLTGHAIFSLSSTFGHTQSNATSEMKEAFSLPVRAAAESARRV